MFEHYKVIHFVGIGGIGMSGIAEVLHNLGYEVTGSDLKRSQTFDRLQSLGIRVSAGHSARNVHGAHVVVVSSAIPFGNPEVVEAARLSIPVIPRAEMLAELGRLKYGILVAGAHGKTTATSLISTVFAAAGLDPTVVIGGKLKALGASARLGQGEFLLAEADESDGSFLKLSPTVGVVTNIDLEHMEFFGTLGALKEAFLSFMNKVPFYGVTIACVDNEHIRELLPSVHRRVLTYGLSPEAELRAVNLSGGFMSVSFDAQLRGEPLGGFDVPLAGAHNALNALAALAVALELKIPVITVKEALRGFEGIQRRLELKGEARGVKVYDDYGHHPTEIRATLGAMKEHLGGGRLVVVFQPHRYTRTRDLFDEFSASFGDADSLILMDIYAAGEEPIDGVSSATLLERGLKPAAAGGGAPDDVRHIGEPAGVVDALAEGLRPGDVVLTLGAGDVWRTGEKLLERLEG